MVDIRKPRKGSMAFRHRRRARSEVPRIEWQDYPDLRLLGFAGYKVGMTHVSYIDDSESPTKGQEIVSAVTILEVPPLVVYGYRLYNGNAVADVITSDEKILKKIGIKKKPKAKEIKEDEIDDVRLLVFAQPDKTGIGKKHPERMEIGLGGEDIKKKIEHAKSLLGKEINIKDVFKPGEYIDLKAVTKGKGWQGPVKRFGVSLQRKKATGRRRHVGTLGQWHPAYVLYTVPMAGQTGYHTRTEYKKRILVIGEKPEEINPDGGFPHYGFVKNPYILIKGSVPGPAKRLVRLRLSVRSPAEVKEPQVRFISK